MDLNAANAQIVAEATKTITNEGQGEVKPATPAPPAGDKQGQAVAADTPAAGKDEAGKTAVVPEADKLKDDTPPYDQDPKWKKARAVESQVEKILEKHNLESLEEMFEKLEAGLSMQQLLGDKDAAKVLEKAQKLEQYEEYWAQQEALKKKESETPEETIARLEKEKKELADKHKAAETSQSEQKKAEQALQEFDKTIKSVLSEAKLEGEAEELAKLLLAVDNPIMSLDDISDKKAVKTASSQVLKKFTAILGKIQQTAIDNYAKGKGTIPVTPKPDTPAVATTTPAVDTSKMTSAQYREHVRANADMEALKILHQAKTAMEGI